MVLLGAGCLGLAAGSPWEIRYIAQGLTPIVPSSTTLGALKSPWILQPVFHGFSILSPSWLLIVMPSTFLAVFIATMVISKGRYLQIRRVPAWRCASVGVSGPAEYSSIGFANPLRRVLGSILGTSQITTPLAEESGASAHPTAAHLETLTSVVEPIESYLYRPIRKTILIVALAAKRLQSGRLNLYVAYMLFAPLLALVLTAALR